jgi:hypothetical protein
MPRRPNLPLHGADFLRALEMRDDHEKTLLMGESEAGNFERVNALLKRGVSVDATTTNARRCSSQSRAATKWSPTSS